MVHQIWKNQPEIQEGLKEVKTIMQTEMRLLHPAVREKIMDYIEAPGKYLRSGLCLLFAKGVDGEIRPEKLYFAAYVEVLHLATLIHDDVIDGAEVRRGISAAHRQFSNRVAIYAGDYLLAYAGRLLAKGLRLMQLEEQKSYWGNERLIEGILAGELAQLMNQGNPDMTMKAYLKQIQGKTAFLFGMACQLGAFQPDSTGHYHAFRAGRSFGMAFQLRDDVIDYRLTAKESGKPALQDLQNGIYTAPLLFAMQEDRSIYEDLHQLIGERSGKQNLLYQILDKVQQTAAQEKTEILMRTYIKKMEKYLHLLQPQHQQIDWRWLVDEMLASYF